MSCSTLRLPLHTQEPVFRKLQEGIEAAFPFDIYASLTAHYWSLTSSSSLYECKSIIAQFCFTRLYPMCILKNLFLTHRLASYVKRNVIPIDLSMFYYRVLTARAFLQRIATNCLLSITSVA